MAVTGVAFRRRGPNQEKRGWWCSAKCNSSLLGDNKEWFDCLRKQFRDSVAPGLVSPAIKNIASVKRHGVDFIFVAVH
jgi:hypothetical protein